MDARCSVRRAAAHFKTILHIISMAIALLMLAACSGVPQNTTAPSTSTPVATVAASAFQVSAQAQDTVVKLSWSPVLNAAGYLVHRDDSRVPLNPKPITDTTYDDIGLTNGRTYTYAVAAVDKDGKVIQQSATVQIAPKAG